jgi:rhomboid protease GluP
MYALYSIGPVVEKIYGPKKYILIYFVSGILSSLLSYTMSPAMSIGASGAIFGLLGAMLVYAYNMRKRIGKGLIKNIVTVIAINLFIGMTIPNIDNFAHIGGLLGGLIISCYFFNILKN